MAENETYTLTKKQRESIERVARDPRVQSLYKESSLSGESETLRYRSQWTETSRFGPSLRSRSGMILSVKIRSVRYPGRDWEDCPEDLEKYKSLCDQAIALFNNTRRPND